MWPYQSRSAGGDSISPTSTLIENFPSPVSRPLYLDLQSAALTRQNMEIATNLRSDFLNFSNY